MSVLLIATSNSCCRINLNTLPSFSRVNPVIFYFSCLVAKTIDHFCFSGSDLTLLPGAGCAPALIPQSLDSGQQTPWEAPPGQQAKAQVGFLDNVQQAGHGMDCGGIHQLSLGWKGS